SSERQAWLKRIKTIQKHEHIVEVVHKRIEQEVEKEFATKINLIHEKKFKLPISQNEIDLFRLLITQEADVNLISRKIKSLPWLQSELIHIFNKYGYLQHATVAIQDPKLIMSYMGFENIRLWFGYLCCRHWLPMKNFRIHNAVRRFLSYQTTHALAVRKLSKNKKLHNDSFYLASCLRNAGAILTLYVASNIVDECWSKWLKDAEIRKESELYETILMTEFPIKLIQKIWLTQLNKINLSALNHFKWDEDHIINWVIEIDQAKSFSMLSEEAKIIEKGACFAKVHLIEHWAKGVLSIAPKIYQYYGIDEAELALLKQINYEKLPIQ
ncbi:MAG: hypothetical protein ISP86_04570, partial [Shewanellaceae bacterium]|nr:hypothetical protein [Shewanellaceae bacterium]